MEKASPSSRSGSASQPAATHWSAVVRAGRPGSAAAMEALEELCRVYWYPLYAFARRQGCSAPDAQDVTQSFLAVLLERNYVARADPAKGRFRSFLLTLFKRFLINDWKRAHARKRSGFEPVVPLDAHLAESRFGTEPAAVASPDVWFERQWAVTLLDQVMSRLQIEYVGSGRGRLYEHLEGCLIRDVTALPYAEIGVRLNLSEAAVKMAMHRLRARYQAVLREEIAKTVTSPEDVEPELEHLFRAFRA